MAVPKKKVFVIPYRIQQRNKVSNSKRLIYICKAHTTFGFYNKKGVCLECCVKSKA